MSRTAGPGRRAPATTLRGGAPPPRASSPPTERRRGGAERERVPPGHGGEEVPAVDGEGGVEQERQCGDGHGGGDRRAQPEEPPARPGAHRQEQRAEDGGPLE